MPLPELTVGSSVIFCGIHRSAISEDLNTQDIDPWHALENHHFRITFVSFMGQWVRAWINMCPKNYAHISRFHYDDVMMGSIASQITSLTIVYSTVYSEEDQRKHQSSASLAFVWGIHRGPVNSPHKWPVTRKMFPFDDVIMCCVLLWLGDTK